MVEQAIETINTVGTSLTGLDEALLDVQNAINAFGRALEADDTSVELKNADFESGLSDWNIESPSPEAAYPENKGVDGSGSITFWKGSDYQMKVYQSISNIPNGTYQISCFAKVNADSTIALFAESGENNVVLPITNEGGLIKRVVEVEVTNGMLQFGIKGSGVNNSIPAGNWIIFDAFEVKWKAMVSIQNPGFENEFEGWVNDASPNVPYLENRGVDGSRSVTCWNGADYFVKTSQTITGLKNGSYAVSAMTKTPVDSLFTIFGISGGTTTTEHILSAEALTKSKVLVQVTDGTLEFGIKGAGENNSVPKGNWVIFDNFEVVRMPDLGIINPGFEHDFTGWSKGSDVDWIPYIENKGVEGSKSVTFWQNADYWVYTSQVLSGLLNGTYEISAMTNTANEGSFVLFGTSRGEEFVHAMAATSGLEKNKVLAKVTDQMLDFGIRGAGEGNSVPAGHWIVFDNFEVKIKSIPPEYEMVLPAPMRMLVTKIEAQNVDYRFTYWQDNQRLNIRSTDTIIKYSVYSITGAMIEQKETKNNHLSIPMRRGIYIIRVLTENGFVDTEKVSIK